MKYLCIFSRLLLGVVFIVSGLTKAIDPVGYGFVITEYLNALGLSFFNPIALSFGALQTAFEFVLGVALLIGLQLRLTSILTMLIMVFFTFFTLWTAISNPVQHCGCFGDAIRLTNWETFCKNLIFTPFSLLLFFKRKRFAPISLHIGEWSTLVLFGVASLALSIHCYRHLPLVDFTGYKVGNNIPEAMTLPEGAPRTQYETLLTYQRGSETKQFSFDELPDSSWTFVSVKTRVLKRGAIPAIPSFEVRTYGGKYITDSLLSVKGALLIFVVPYMDKAHPKALEEVGMLFKQVAEHLNIPFVTLSGSGEEQTISRMKGNDLHTPLYYSDAKTLYTMIRSNPGLILLYDANVVAKWSAWDIPSFQSFSNLLDRDWEVVSAKAKISEHLTMELFAVSLILLLAILGYIFRKMSKPEAD